MDINQLEVFLGVANEKSFSRAAEALHRTQPAVSQAIRRLENELGEPLFDRSSKDGTLTAAGRVLFDFAQQMLNLRQHAHSAIRELRDLHRGKLSLGANEYTVMCLLPLIPIFRSHPAEYLNGDADAGSNQAISREWIGCSFDTAAGRAD